MTVDDAIAYAEARFECHMGYPGTYHRGPDKGEQYVNLVFRLYPNETLNTHEDIENILTARMVNQLGDIWSKAKGKVKLWWRLENKARFDKDKQSLTTRLLIEGCQDYGPHRRRRIDSHLRVVHTRAIHQVTLQSPVIDGEEIDIDTGPRSA